MRADHWCVTVAEGAWQTIEVRAGEKGPVVVQAVWTLAQARSEGRVSDTAEVLVVFREQQSDGSWKHDYLLSNAVLDLSLAEFARVFKAEHRVEECLQRAKGEAGLADYEPTVRSWLCWILRIYRPAFHRDQEAYPRVQEGVFAPRSAVTVIRVSDR